MKKFFRAVSLSIDRFLLSSPLGYCNSLINTFRQVSRCRTFSTSMQIEKQLSSTPIHSENGRDKGQEDPYATYLPDVINISFNKPASYFCPPPPRVRSTDPTASRLKRITARERTRGIAFLSSVEINARYT